MKKILLLLAVLLMVSCSKPQKTYILEVYQNERGEYIVTYEQVLHYSTYVNKETFYTEAGVKKFLDSDNVEVR